MPPPFAGLVLAVFPHPDDESYAAGGTLARCAAGGVEIQLACASRGERGPDWTGASADPAHVAILRSEELSAACAALGLGDPLHLDLPDGALSELVPADGARRVEELLARLRPRTVLTLGRDGVYGNRDHLQVTEWVEGAVRALPERSRPLLLEAAFPRGLFQPLWRGLRRLRAPVVVPGMAADDFGVARSEVDLIVDIAAFAAQKRAAIAAHRSQRREDDLGSFLLPGLSDALLSEEWWMEPRL